MNFCGLMGEGGENADQYLLEVIFTVNFLGKGRPGGWSKDMLEAR